MVVVEADMKVCEIAAVLLLDSLDQLFRADAFLCGAQHDRGAVGIIGTDINAVVAAQFLETYPDVGLDVFDQMTDVDGAIRVGQGAGDQYGAAFLTHSRVSGLKP